LLKNCAINFVHRVAAFAAAEKRDYAELFRRCQQLAEEIYSLNSLPTTTATSNQPETRTTSTSPPLQHPRRRLRFGAVFCSEGRILDRFFEQRKPFLFVGSLPPFSS
jgi:hypothetical protein